MVKAAKNNGGIVKYHWPKANSDKPVLKFSYAINFEPFEWMMGTGVYVDNVQKELDIIKAQSDKDIKEHITFFILVSLGIILFSLLVIYISIKKSVTNPLEELIKRTETFLREMVI